MRKHRRRYSNKKNVVMISSICIVLTLFLCVGYAAFSTDVTLNAKGNVIKSTKLGDTRVAVVETGDGLYADENENGRYVYKGANPDNYITFSGETWRIVSIESDGTIKIVKSAALSTNYAWDSNNGSGWNNSALKTYLNGTYYNSLSGKNNISNYDWNIGTITNNSSNLSTMITEEKSSTTTAYVGLLSPSDIIKANTNKTSCGSYSLVNSNYSTCASTNWLTSLATSGMQMLNLTSDSSPVSIYTNSGSFTNTTKTNTSYGTIPSVYLDSTITLNGSGTSSSPYTTYTPPTYVYAWNTETLPIGITLQEIMDYAGITDRAVLQSMLFETFSAMSTATSKNFGLKYGIEDDTIKEAYACGLWNGQEFCLQGSTDVSMYAANKAAMQAFFTGSNGQCYTCDSSSCNCGGGGLFVYDCSDGYVIVSAGSSHCYVSSGGYAGCPA